MILTYSRIWPEALLQRAISNIAYHIPEIEVKGISIELKALTDINPNCPVWFCKPQRTIPFLNLGLNNIIAFWRGRKCQSNKKDSSAYLDNEIMDFVMFITVFLIIYSEIIVGQVRLIIGQVIMMSGNPELPSGRSELLRASQPRLRAT